MRWIMVLPNFHRWDGQRGLRLVARNVKTLKRLTVSGKKKNKEESLFPTETFHVVPDVDFTITDNPVPEHLPPS
jgi:hypothetical protein